ncbi:Hcp family type VI secretion system effector [Massilia horti]|uniref:Type VI secretion system tube protein Hcp n=1 Tax=Massilia horti TaxID=2562153 RepID=A0A4Y9SV13_9BURK|nr:type VI secretion system tube protein Hcp [Massilia horti]TFW30521.1 type VI secretion system tube protein Hcp [Massilia horti]TFW30560.1 type VI secretion system tube protein Hcp [Massilia horti]
MAIDAYLQIEGIKGESMDDKHKNWIEISHVTWSIHQPRAASLSTAGGHTSGRSELSNLTFKKLADLSSPILQQHCAMGRTIPKARIEFMRADGVGKPVNYYTIELENVMISGVTPNSGDGGIITEQVHLAYSKMKWTYTKQSIKGGAEGSTAGGWDCAANKCV